MRAFLVGQPDLAVPRRLQQQLGAGAEQVGADGEDRVLGVVEDAELGAHPGQQFRQAEGLGDVVVGAGVEAADHVLLGIRAGQHDDRHRACRRAGAWRRSRGHRRPAGRYRAGWRRSGHPPRPAWRRPRPALSASSAVKSPSMAICSARVARSAASSSMIRMGRLDMRSPAEVRGVLPCSFRIRHEVCLLVDKHAIQYVSKYI